MKTCIKNYLKSLEVENWSCHTNLLPSVAWPILTFAQYTNVLPANRISCPPGNASTQALEKGPNLQLLQVCSSLWNWDAKRPCSNKHRCCHLMKLLKVTFSYVEKITQLLIHQQLRQPCLHNWLMEIENLTDITLHTVTKYLMFILSVDSLWYLVRNTLFNSDLV